MKKNNKNIILFIIILISSIIITGLMIFLNNNDSYWFLNFLPLLFVLVLMVCYNTFSNIFTSFSVLLLIGCYYMRIVILPLVYVIFDYSSLVTNEVFSSYIVHASLLTIYEFFIVMFFCNIVIRKQNKKKDMQLSRLEKKEIVHVKNKKMTYIVFILVLFVVISYILYPTFISYFHFIFETNYEAQNAYSINYVAMQQSIPKLLYWLVVYAFGILQIILPILLISYINKTKLTQNFKFLISIIVVLAVLLIATPDVAKSIIISLTLGIVLLKLYPKKKRIISFVLIVGFIPVVFLGIFIKSGVHEIGNSISSVSQAYFSGIPNIATSFLLQGRPNPLMIFTDIVKATPFVLSFFKDVQSTPNLFNYILFNNTDGHHSQIIPMIGQSMYYFGILLSPIISVLSATIALYFEKKYSQISYICEKYLYLLIAIYFAIAPVVYNFSIMISIFLQLFLPCLLIIKLPKTLKEYD